MARLTAEQAASFPSGGGRTSFLSLQNDKDQAVVRFAYNRVEDILTDSVHEVKDNEGKFKQIDCLRHSQDEPTSVCPLCASGSPIKKTLYFNVVNVETGEMQIWQRSEAYFRNNMLTLFQECTANGTPLCAIPFKIIRNGAKGDTKTTYTIIPMQADNVTLDQLPEEIIPQDQGLVKVFSFNELQDFVNTGIYPDGGNNAPQQAPVAQQGVMPRGNNYANIGQQVTVDQYQQAPINNNRRTINNNNGGY